MFKTVKRIIDWCGEFKGKLYLGFIFSFFSYWFAAMPVMVAPRPQIVKQEPQKDKHSHDNKTLPDPRAVKRPGAAPGI